MVDQVEQRDLAGERHPGQRRVVVQGQARLGVDVAEQGPSAPRRLSLVRTGSKTAAGPPPGGSSAGRRHAVVVAEPAAALQLERHVDPPRLEGGDQVVEPPQGLRVERLGVVAGVVEQAAVGAERRVEVAEPDEVDARPRQAVGQRVGPLGLEERGRRIRTDAEEPRPAPLLEVQPAVLDRHEALAARRGASSRNEKSRAELAAIVAARAAA